MISTPPVCLGGAAPSGCEDATNDLPRLIERRRADIADRIAGLHALDARLSDLLGHLDAARRTLPLAGGPCCETANAVVAAAEDGCACCALGPDPVTPGSRR